MPRNTAGVYTLTGDNPVIAGTTILDTWANNTLNDVAQAITDSLDRQGRGSMLAPFKLTDGAVSAPAFAFNSEPSSGLWRTGAGSVGMSILGTNVATWSASAFSVAGAINANGAVIELGNPANTVGAFLDFHTSGNVIDYDARISGSGGSATVGAGKLNYAADAGHQFTGFVGIGMGPGVELDITCATNRGIRITDGTMSAVFFAGGSGGLNVGTATNHSVNFYANNVNQANINSIAQFTVGAGGTKLQMGAGVADGLYCDASNIAIRTRTAGSIYFQESGGGVTFGVIAAGGFSITPNAVFTNNVQAASFTVSSDERLKTNVHAISTKQARDFMRLKSYQYVKGGKDEAGFIAQDVALVAPELVGENPDGYLTLDSGNGVAAYLHAALRDVIDRLDCAGL